MEHLIEIDGTLLSSNASLSGDAEMNRSLQLDGEIMMDSGGETETIEIDGALEFSASSVSGDVGTSQPLRLAGDIKMGGGGDCEWNDVKNKPFETIDNNTLISEEGVLKVNVASKAEGDNTRPITSAAVHVIVGNIETLLELI